MGEVVTVRSVAQARERERRPYITADDDEGLSAKQRKRVQNASTGFERMLPFIAVEKSDSETAAIAQSLFQQRSFPRDIDNDLANTAVGERFDVVLDERLAAHAQQRLRRVVRQRAHPLAPPGSQDHRAHGHYARLAGGLSFSRAIAGSTCCARKRASGVSPG